eukprot:scaffold95368_cov28-Tisochrysis_lutea.AAC.5
MYLRQGEVGDGRTSEGSRRTAPWQRLRGYAWRAQQVTVPARAWSPPKELEERDKRLVSEDRGAAEGAVSARLRDRARAECHAG